MYQCQTCNKDCDTRFCSLPCYWKSLRGKSTWNYQGEENRECPVCNKIFLVRKVSSKRFCSKFCGNKGKKKKQNYWGKKEVVCQVCHKTFIAWKHQTKRKYCTKKCLGIANARRMSGDGNWNWKGGVPTRGMNTVIYKNWRKAVFERDKYKCVWCGYDKGRILQADHIKSWVQYPKLRFDVNNGRTLCVDCHKKTETFGRKMILSNK